jgi:ATP dependent DNA ligase domain
VCVPAALSAISPLACLRALSGLQPGRNGCTRSSTTAFASWRGANDDGVRLYTRNGYDFAGRFPQIVEAVSKLKVRSCFIDGEAIVVNTVAFQPLICFAHGVTTMRPSRSGSDARREYLTVGDAGFDAVRPFAVTDLIAQSGRVLARL